MSKREPTLSKKPKPTPPTAPGADLHIRPATPEDIPALYGLICELADYEKLTHEMKAGEEDIRSALFGKTATAEAIMAEVAAEPIGFALFFHNFSTFAGRRGLYLEDLYVKPEFRRRGYGRLMLRYLARLALDRGCGRFEWMALNWNKPAIAAYEKIGSVPMREWTVFRLSGAELEALAK